MNNSSKLIHIARIQVQQGKHTYLFLRQVNPHTFTWYEEGTDGFESETTLSAQNIEDAIQLAVKAWKTDYFRTVICGFRYTLPERDEHGINALFYQMVASYSSVNGIYFDEEIGCNCIVQNASDEARKLWKRLQANEKTT